MKINKFIGLLALFTFPVAFNSCKNENAKYKVHFEKNTTLATNELDDVSVRNNHCAKKPNLYTTDESYKNYVVTGWYKEAECKNEWVFKKTKVTSNITLYAKWQHEYTITYHIGNETTTDTIYEGECLPEDKTLAQGFEYEGSYYDASYNEKVDFTKPVTDDLDIYIKKSDTIYLSETTPSMTLSENLEAFKDSDGTTHGTPIEGYAEPITLNDGNTYTLCDFGWSPNNGDAYMEFATHLDISKSQKLSFTFKNLGKAKDFKIYFTTMIDVDNSKYSETGSDYSENFVKTIELTEDEQKMSKDDDKWVTKVFDLSEIGEDTYGYSVWGTSPYLGALRIQFQYKSSAKIWDH